MKSMKPNNVFAPYEKQGQRSAIFHGFFFKLEKGKQGTQGTQGTQLDTGDTNGHRGHMGHKRHKGTQGTQGRQGDTRGHRTKGTNIVFDLSFT